MFFSNFMPLTAPSSRAKSRAPVAEVFKVTLTGSLAVAALIAPALVAFLPARWFPLSDWRAVLDKLGARLPATVSAQPWLTFQSTLQFLLGLSWGYYLLATDWSLPARRKAWTFIAL